MIKRKPISVSREGRHPKQKEKGRQEFDQPWGK